MTTRKFERTKRGRLLHQITSFMPYVAVILGLLCTILMAAVLKTSEQGRTKDNFLIDADNRYKLVKDAFSGISHQVNALGRYLESTQNISETGFKQFARTSISSERVIAYMLLDLEKGQAENVELRSLIKYSTLAVGIELLDSSLNSILSSPKTKSKLLEAIKQKTMLALATSANEQNNDPILVYCCPVLENSVLFRPSVDLLTEADKEKNPPFMIMAFVNIANLVRSKIHETEPTGLTTVIFDNSSSEINPLFLYEARIGKNLGSKLPSKDFYYKNSFKLADNSWTIIVQPSSAYALLPSQKYKTVLLIGLLLCGFLFLLILYLKWEKSKAEKLAASASQDYESFFNINSDLFAIIDRNGRFLSLNKQWQYTLGYRRDEILGKEYLDLLHPEDLKATQKRLERLITEEKGADSGINRYRAKDGSWHYIEWHTQLSEDKNTFYTAGRDVSIQIAHEKEMLQSIKDKEILLKEVHHRVKNNMQIISSLLNLEAARFDDSSFAHAAKEAQGRIHTMAMVHEQLYRHENLEKMDLGSYVLDLANRISDEYSEGQCTLLVDAENISIDLDTAIPCGLALNELLTNAFKYSKNKSKTSDAKTNAKDGKVIVSVIAGLNSGTCAILVEDNGPGLPPDAIKNAENGLTLGLNLVQSLCQQLGGDLVILPGKGARLELRFPYPRYASDLQS